MYKNLEQQKREIKSQERRIEQFVEKKQPGGIVVRQRDNKFVRRNNGFKHYTGSPKEPEMDLSEH